MNCRLSLRSNRSNNRGGIALPEEGIYKLVCSLREREGNLPPLVNSWLQRKTNTGRLFRYYGLYLMMNKPLAGENYQRNPNDDKTD